VAGLGFTSSTSAGCDDAGGRVDGMLIVLFIVVPSPYRPS
jgi:hypothetical protein